MKKLLSKIKSGASDGLSIMLAVIMVTVVVFFSIGVTTVVTDSVRQAGNVKQGTTAYYAAEKGIEQALWLNQKIATTTGAVGLDKSLATETVGTTGNVTDSFKISGTATGILETTANGKFIVPFPWTGNAPWHGEGSNPDGGCNPQKPPLRNGTGAGKTFSLAGLISPYDYEIEHPCNWNILKVGEKASIPLYNLSGGTETKFDDFTLRVRAPCKEGWEMCNAPDRLELNCWDKGTQEKRCSSSIFAVGNNPNRGEIVLNWQINAENLLTKNLLSFISDHKTKLTAPDYYVADDSEVYENKINNGKIGTNLFAVLNSTTEKGKDAITYTEDLIKNFIDANSKPVLTLSIVSNLVGCNGKNSCTNAVDNPDNKGTYIGPVSIPYLEYQVVLNSATASNPPANQENVISAEGQSGPFNQTIQVKVPNDNSSLEYVIQQ